MITFREWLNEKKYKVVKNPYTDKMTAIEVPKKDADEIGKKIESKIGKYFGSVNMKNSTIFYPVINKDTDDIINMFK